MCPGSKTQLLRQSEPFESLSCCARGGTSKLLFLESSRRVLTVLSSQENPVFLAYDSAGSASSCEPTLRSQFKQMG